MSAKQILFRSEAREKLLRGAGALFDAIRVTLGPKSKCVLIGRKWGKPLACNDGVTIAKEFELTDPNENLGAQMIRQAAERTSESVGDGTSTATVLAYAIVSEGIRNVTAGASAVDLKRGLDRGMRACLRALQALSKRLESQREKAQVASISAHNDTEMGELVAQAMERVGPEGAITVEESRTTETTLEIVEGLKIEHGYISPYFVTNSEKMEVILENPLILLSDKRIGRLAEFLPLLEKIAKSGRQLLLIADDVEPDTLATLVVNKIRGILTSAAVKAPSFGDQRKAILQDIAILTGTRVLSDELGLSLTKLEPGDLGSAKRVVISKDSTVVVSGSGNRHQIELRCAEIRSQIDHAQSNYETEKLRERLAKLSGGVAVIRVGAPSETEMQNRKEAFDDAINATKAATSEGIVPGGGLALLRTLDAVQQEIQVCDGDERTGVLILKRALEAPARQIAENSAVDSGVVVSKLREGSGSVGFDAANNTYVDLMSAGIIDPTKVVRVALENAVSAAGILLFTEAILTEAPEPAEPKRERFDSPL